MCLNIFIVNYRKRILPNNYSGLPKAHIKGTQQKFPCGHMNLFPCCTKLLTKFYD